MPNYTNSVWTEDSDVAPRRAHLEGSVRCDVAVIGAGITGITAAALLKQAGQRVAVVESRRVGKGETAKTTAHLTESLDVRYFELIGSHGERRARRVAESQREAIARIAAFIDELAIDCDFQRVPGYLFTERPEHVELLEKEAEACSRLGLSVSLLDRAPLPFATRRALRFDNQAQFQPRRYLLALADTIPGDGCEIYEDSHVLDVAEGEPCRVLTATGEVVADRIIVAANVPVINRFFMAAKIPAYRSYVIGATIAREDPHGLFWDTESPYHYIRTYRERDGECTLLVGGADHKVGQEPDTTRPHARLEAYVRQRFGDLPIHYHWSGQIIEPLDGLPYIGRNSLSSRVFVATGFAGQGMTMGTLAAMIMSDLALGHRNRHAHSYRATRLQPLRSVRKFLSENIDFPSHLLKDRLHGHHVSLQQLPAGEGDIVTVEGERLAVYRDHTGDLRALSPVCTHMACLVQWNTVEKSWDCPCHGSRFDPTGRVLNGPATRALEARPLPDAELGEPGPEPTEPPPPGPTAPRRS